MKSDRMIRQNNDFAREIAEIIRSELKDPRVGSIVSVLKADTSVDLKYCKVYVSILGGPEEQKETLAGLRNAAGFIRKQLAERANPRRTPELNFLFDDSVEYGFKMDKLIEDVIKRDTNGDMDDNE
ncbi:MAG: 30S ribosome-binding factor RbfA [Clostridiales bacterium]|jgi:ribosome-binding factor A|nr:30S ribosome-binding factor RbfA [Clostridiales bacterium]